MLEDQFYMRLLLQMAVGVIYVLAYMNMAKRNPMELTPKRHIVLKVFSGVFAIIGIIMGVAGIYAITQISFPSESIEPPITSDMIVRTSDETMYWGYATALQHQTISLISGVFEFFALSAYCFLFKESQSKWYSKVGKVLFCILFYGLYASATNFHYFDVYEWIAPIVFAIMAFFAIRSGNKQTKTKLTDTSLCDDAIYLETKEDNSRYMPSNIMDTDVEQVTPDEKMSNGQEDAEDAEDYKRFMPRSYEEQENDEIVAKSISEDIFENSHKNKITEIPKLEEEKSDMPVADGSEVAEDIKNVQEEETSNDNLMFCKYCGKRIEKDSLFCKYCGRKL